MAMDPRAQYAYNFYLQRGYTPAGAAGIVGNIHAESGFSTKASGDTGTAAGLFQWRGERQAGLMKYAANNGLDPQSMDAQLGYADYEMRTGSDAGAGKAYSALQNASDPSAAAAAFMHNYERPNADPSINNIAGRQNFANSIFGSGPIDPSQLASANLDGAAGQGSGIASLDTAGVSSLPTVQAAAADPTSGIFSLLAQGQPQKQAPPAAPMAAPRKSDTRTADEKLAATSQTPNVYYDRLRNRNG